MAFRLLVRGDYACFRRPEFSADFVSYDAITPVAARHLFEAIHGPAAIRWNIDLIDVLHPIRTQWTVVPHRELAVRRRALVLSDVAYIVTAGFELTNLARHDETAAQHAAMFRRRVRQSRFHHQPFLGLTEFPADLELIEKDDARFADRGGSDAIDLGWMVYDTRGSDRTGTRFFRAKLIGGTMEVPPRDSEELAS